MVAVTATATICIMNSTDILWLFSLIVVTLPHLSWPLWLADVFELFLHKFSSLSSAKYQPFSIDFLSLFLAANKAAYRNSNS